jgi:hypothetical protein
MDPREIHRYIYTVKSRDYKDDPAAARILIPSPSVSLC